MKKIYVSMVADLFHYGHVDFLRRARAMGDYLIVGLLRDEKVERYKRTPVLTWEERKAVVESCKYVDEVIESPGQPMDDAYMQANGIALKVYAVADEAENQNHLERYRRNGLSEGYYQRIDYTPSISTTQILRRVMDRRDDLEKRTVEPDSKQRAS